MKKTGYFFCSLSVLLIVITLLGQWTSLGNYESSKPQDLKKFDPLLVESTKSYRSMLDLAQAQMQKSTATTEQEKMIVLYNLVINRFTHTEATHNLFSNWILFSAGQIDPAFLHIYDLDLLLSRGYSALCDQSSYLLVKLALDNGIRARHVGLNGHVVMEAWYNKDWHLYDPDTEVIPLDSTNNVLSVEGLAKDPVLLEKYYGKSLEQIISSREDNTYMSYPLGARFEWKNNVLVYVEKAAEIFKYIVPMIIFTLGILLIRPLKKNQIQ